MDVYPGNLPKVWLQDAVYGVHHAVGQGPALTPFVWSIGPFIGSFIGPSVHSLVHSLTRIFRSTDIEELLNRGIHVASHGRALVVRGP